MTYIQQIEKLIGETGVKVTPQKAMQYLGGDRALIEVATSRFLVKAGDVTIAHFNLCQIPGCCGVCMVFWVEVNSKYRKRGLGKLLYRMMEQMAYDNGYTTLLATDKVSNPYQQKIFNGGKWLRVDEFKNKRTNNQVGIYTRKVADTNVMTGISDYHIRQAP